MRHNAALDRQVLDHPDIAHLPHLKLSAPPPDGQIWRPTKTPGRGQLSTVEAVRLAMQELARVANPSADDQFDDLLFFFRRIRDKIDTDYARKDCVEAGSEPGPRPCDLGFKQARARLGGLQRDRQREKLEQRHATEPV